MPRISPHATVDSPNVADNVVIGPFTYIGPDVVIGPGCVIDNNVIITGKTTIGQDNHIFPMVSIGHPEVPGMDNICTIGQANSIREHVIISPGTNGPTEIGQACLIMAACRIGASASVGSHVVLANCSTIGRKSAVADYVRGSAFAVVDDGVRVGAYSFLNGYAHIDRTAPPFAMLEGDPYRIRGVNAHNLSRCGFGNDDIKALKRAYRELYNGRGSRPDDEVLTRLLDDPDTNALVRHAMEAIVAGASA
jgi:UDP-N-acetylglucosamine acyltransferase